MYIEMKNRAQLALVQWNNPEAGIHTVEFIDSLVPENVVRLKVSSIDTNMILGTAGVWILRVYMSQMFGPITRDEWTTVGVFSSWNAAKQRLTDMIAAGENIINDPEGKAWDIRRWELEG